METDRSLIRPRFIKGAIRCVKDHNLLHRSPLLRNACVRQVVLDKRFPLRVRPSLVYVDEEDDVVAEAADPARSVGSMEAVLAEAALANTAACSWRYAEGLRNPVSIRNCIYDTCIHTFVLCMHIYIYICIYI